jgi:putative copper resistance protein D
VEPLGLLQAGAALLLNAGFGWLVGSLLARRWLAGAHPQLLRQGEIGAGLACLGGSFVSLWAATALMGDVGLGAAFTMLPMVLLQTGYGQAALVGMVVAAVLVSIPYRHWRARAMLLLLFALTRASVSHAGEHGLVSVAVGVEWLHLVLIGVWVGAVGVAAWVVLPAQPGAAYLAALSRAATLALVGIVASGAFNVWQRIGALDQMLSNPYGLALTVKLLLFGAAVLLGGYNRLVGFAQAARGQGATALMVLRIESLVLLGALAGAAVLASLPPPG